MVASYFQRQGLDPPFYLVPIPDTKTTLESSTGPWTSVTAMAIAAKFEGDVEALDVLRWKKNLSHLSAEAQDSTPLYEKPSSARKDRMGQTRRAGGLSGGQRHASAGLGDVLESERRSRPSLCVCGKKRAPEAREELCGF